MKFNITNSVDKNYDIVVIPCFSDEKVQKYSHILDKLRDKKISSCKSSLYVITTRFCPDHILITSYSVGRTILKQVDNRDVLFR